MGSGRWDRRGWWVGGKARGRGGVRRRSAGVGGEHGEAGAYEGSLEVGEEGCLAAGDGVVCGGSERRARAEEEA